MRGWGFLKELEYHEVRVPKLPDLSEYTPRSPEYDFLEVSKYAGKKAGEEFDDRVASDVAGDQ